MAKSFNVDQISKLLNVSVQRIHQYVEKGMPKAGRGRYNPAECMTWLLRHQQEILRNRGILAKDDPQSILEERRRLIKAQADREELELAARRGELVPLSVFERELQQTHMTLRQRLLTLPRIAPQLEGENRTVIAHKLNAAVRGLLVALSTGNGHHDSQPGSAPAPPGNQTAN